VDAGFARRIAGCAVATGSCTIYEEIDPRKVFEALAEAG
jgi:hypothetical protein